MAKTSALTRFSPRPIIVNVPRPKGRVRRAGARAVHHVRRGGRSVGRGMKKFPTIPVAIGGLIAGYADGKGFLDKLPVIAGSRMNTIALVGWAATRFVRNQSIRAAGLAMLGAATFAIGKAQAATSTTSGDGGAGYGGGY